MRCPSSSIQPAMVPSKRTSWRIVASAPRAIWSTSTPRLRKFSSTALTGGSSVPPHTMFTAAFPAVAQAPSPLPCWVQSSSRSSVVGRARRKPSIHIPCRARPPKLLPFCAVVETHHRRAGQRRLPQVTYAEEVELVRSGASVSAPLSSRTARRPPSIVRVLPRRHQELHQPPDLQPGHRFRQDEDESVASAQISVIWMRSNSSSG